MRVMIVDDETIIRVGLKSIIDWKSEGYELIGEARNGQEALDKIQGLQPDIIITDLKMPQMDGITLIDTLMKKNYHGQIIVLSNYDDFNLVKEAMKKGAMEYLLKLTLEPTELLKVLQDASIKLSQSKKSEVTSEEVDQVHIKQRQIILNRYIVDFIKGHIQEDHLKHLLKDIDMTVDEELLLNKNLIFVYLYGGDVDKVEDLGKYTDSMINLMNEAFNDVKYILAPISYKEYLIIIDADKDDGIKEKMEKHLALYVSSQIKLYQDHYNKLEELKNVVKDAYNDFFFEGVLEGPAVDATLDYRDFSVKIQELIESKDEERLMNLLNNTLDLARIEHWKPIDVKRFMDYFMDVARQVMIQWGGGITGMIQKLKERFEVVRTHQEYYYIGKFCIHTIMEEIHQLKNQVYREEIIKVIEYIFTHLSEKIVLSDLADFVNLNESYLCRIFKKEVGVSITDFINDKRIDKAKELLDATNLFVKEVGVKVGIPNPYYFNRVFKKATGMSPKEFRERGGDG